MRKGKGQTLYTMNVAKLKRDLELAVIVVHEETGEEIVLPKSQITLRLDGKGVGQIDMPTWLAKAKRLL